MNDYLGSIKREHPGAFIRREIITPHGLSVTDAASVLGVGRQALSNLLNESAALSPEMALRIEKAFGASLEALMGMQNSYDIAQMRQREGEIAVVRYVGPPPSEQQKLL
ncbi:MULTISPECIES: HigA family addiction module antitoxin [Methylorubrum]|uniref:HigA family addiction module antitoxin n=1 Tax=Methylorubrum TaxID=2282523 RepID=UPI00209F8D08|nr:MULTISPECIES: HigA family addiction module antitoxin [Methylorubrum]MCP1551698.1 addiction module HigA family antidote [Methylorubrum zatmanii]MCP1556627.1 addiction module HigA family antidote [Methylorubrum extorquens]MCP1581746.1 addiction module HigA family antidote [Methylorubrum extorquens]